MYSVPARVRSRVKPTSRRFEDTVQSRQTRFSQIRISAGTIISLSPFVPDRRSLFCVSTEEPDDRRFYIDRYRRMSGIMSCLLQIILMIRRAYTSMVNCSDRRPTRPICEIAIRWLWVVPARLIGIILRVLYDVSLSMIVDFSPKKLPHSISSGTTDREDLVLPARRIFVRPAMRHFFIQTRQPIIVLALFVCRGLLSPDAGTSM